jgi:hypothetical protein
VSLIILPVSNFTKITIIEGMVTKSHKSINIISLFVFSLGVLLGVAVTAIMAWGGMESAFFDRVPNSDRSLTTLRCPMVISSTETALISVTISNPSQFEVQPTIATNISAGYFTISDEYSQQLKLGPGEKQTLEWQASVQNAAYNGRLIFVHVKLHGSYPISDSTGTCGIVVLKLGGIKGDTLLRIVAVAAMLLTTTGWLLWYRAHPSELNPKTRGLTNGLRALGIVLVLGILLGLLKLWFFAILALMIVILLTIILWSQYGSGDLTLRS